MSLRTAAFLFGALLWTSLQATTPAGSPASAPVQQPSGPAWSALSPAQQAALAPLRTHWTGIDADRKTKWLGVAQRYPSLPPAERERIQARMAQWAAMSPTERGRARVNYQELRKLPAAERQASWQAYRALPPEQQQALARRAAPATAAAATAPGPTAVTAPANTTRKRMVPVNPPRTPAKPVTATVVQVKPGATTTLLTKPTNPPPHTQPGLPKIAATPEFVDPQTLLPTRGPQGAATIRLNTVPRPAAASGS
ncbi:MAG: DUF3106 domain-containing protein [Rubrivivax sp.]|nr:DUF3106 domain-containing protein [Rubrivivax sp.]